MRVVSGSSARFCLGFFLRRQQALADDGLFVVNDFPTSTSGIGLSELEIAQLRLPGFFIDFGTTLSPWNDPGSYKHPQSATSVGGVKLLRQGEARVWTRLTSQSGLCDSTSASNESAERQPEGEQRGLFSESFSSHSDTTLRVWTGLHRTLGYLSCSCHSALTSSVTRLPQVRGQGSSH